MALGEKGLEAPQQQTLIMGVINVTPDSFFDGGQVQGAAAVAERCRQLMSDGADLLDIGGESSRPGAEPVGLEEELRRVLPALEAAQNCGGALSIDTYRAETARRALALGVRMINDISACRIEPELAEVVAAARCAYVLMHMQGLPRNMQQNPQYNDVVGDIMAFFEERLTFLDSAGVRRDQVWLDPGFGFGKTLEHNLEILRRLSEFKRLGMPLLLGTSNKASIDKVLGLPLEQRVEGSAATVAIAIWNGANALRVHDVRTMARVARMTDAIKHGRVSDA